jgi:hypothetical protein
MKWIENSTCSTIIGIDRYLNGRIDLVENVPISEKLNIKTSRRE